MTSLSGEDLSKLNPIHPDFSVATTVWILACLSRKLAWYLGMPGGMCTRVPSPFWCTHARTDSCALEAHSHTTHTHTHTHAHTTQHSTAQHNTTQRPHAHNMHTRAHTVWFINGCRMILFILVLMPGFLPAFLRYWFDPSVYKNLVYGDSLRHQFDAYLPW